MAVAAVPTRAAGGWIGRFYRSTIGKKIAMAVSGIVLVGFITVHMAGNLLAYAGPAALDGYGAYLRSKPPLLWGTRLVVLVSLVVHVHAAWALSRLAASARPAGYARLTPQASTLAARLMRIGGVLLAVFVVFHILHFTTGTILPSRFEPGAIYDNVRRSFGLGWVLLFYLAAMVALVFHLRHGVWSFFQTVGANHPHLDGLRRGLAWAAAILIPLGFAAVPLGVAFGLLR